MGAGNWELRTGSLIRTRELGIYTLRSDFAHLMLRECVAAPVAESATSDESATLVFQASRVDKRENATL